MKKVLFLMVGVLALGLVFAGCSEIANITAPGTTETEGVVSLTRNGEVPEIPLYAGQDILVGEVIVTVVGDTLCVKYVLDQNALDEGWLIYETHIAVGKDESDIPQTKKGNPIPGHFPYGDDELYEGESSYEECDIPIPVECDIPFVIAAHAVIEKTECVVIVPAPYSACDIKEYEQGLRQDGEAVKDKRSVPENALCYETGKNESNFFSLGFGGWMILEFGCPIINGNGNDIRIIEDTWGTYPVEKAMVSASQNGTDWTELGEANNEARDQTYKYHTISEFDLGDLEWATYIKVEDTTNILLYASRPNAEGYDLNAVLALHDCEECTTYSETAWGGEEEFFGKNWAKYFTYDGLCWEEILEILANNPDGVTTSNDLKEGCEYQLAASGTCNWRVPPASNGYLADAGFWLRDDSYGTGWTQPSIGGSIAYWDGTTKEGIDWDGDYNDGHIYTYVFTATETGPMTFFFNDDQYSDNSGSLTLKISSCF